VEIQLSKAKLELKIMMIKEWRKMVDDKIAQDMYEAKLLLPPDKDLF